MLVFWAMIRSFHSWFFAACRDPKLNLSQRFEGISVFHVNLRCPLPNATFFPREIRPYQEILGDYQEIVVVHNPFIRPATSWGKRGIGGVDALQIPRKLSFLFWFGGVFLIQTSSGYILVGPLFKGPVDFIHRRETPAWVENGQNLSRSFGDFAYKKDKTRKARPGT